MKRWNAGHRGSRVGSVSWALAFGALTSFGCSGTDDGDPDPTPITPIAGTGTGGSSGNGDAAGGTTPAPAGTSSGGTAGALPTTAEGGQAGDVASERGGAGGAGTGGSMGSESGAGSPENGGRGGRSSGRGGRGGTSSGGAPGTAGTSGSASAGTAGASAMGGPTEGELAGILEAHNEVRAMVMTGDPLPPLTWSEEIAEFAQEWADTLASECDSIHHRMPNSYGENLAMRGYSGNISLPPYGAEAVEAWAAELECWTYGTIGPTGTEMCDAVCIAEKHSNGCGHYTQLVWRTTRRVGCAYSSCRKGNELKEFVVCNYDPPGNYLGRTPY